MLVPVFVFIFLTKTTSSPILSSTAKAFLTSSRCGVFSFGPETIVKPTSLRFRSGLSLVVSILTCINIHLRRKFKQFSAYLAFRSFHLIQELLRLSFLLSRDFNHDNT